MGSTWGRIVERIASARARPPSPSPSPLPPYSSTSSPFGSLSFQFQSIKMAMSDFRRKKLLYVFSTFFDVDNSGGIDDKEFTAAAERLCRVHGWTVNEGKGAAVLKSLLDIWGAIHQGDPDGDDQVDKDEWCNLFKNGCTEPWQQKYKDLIFDLHDTSGDGSVVKTNSLLSTPWVMSRLLTANK